MQKKIVEVGIQSQLGGYGPIFHIFCKKLAKKKLRKAIFCKKKCKKKAWESNILSKKNATTIFCYNAFSTTKEHGQNFY